MREMTFDLAAGRRLTEKGGVTCRIWDHPKFGRCEAFHTFGMKNVGDLKVPNSILFRARIDGDGPLLEMGVELVNGRPECTFVHVESDGATPVLFSHLKAIPIERLVADVFGECSQRVVARDGSRVTSAIGPGTSQQRRTIEKMQRRRRKPDDIEVLQKVAAIYKANPAAPRKAVAEQLGMSPETAGRWARQCTERGLLPPTRGKGHKRK